MQTKNELEIAKAGTVTDFVVLLPATLPGAPIAPERFMVLSAGMVSGLLLCLLFVAVSYVVNDKISSQTELERYITAPILGTIPFYRRVRSRGSTLVVRDSPKSAISEAFRTVRTNMQFVGAQQEQRVISVTSTVGTEGKTFVATNLGNVIALSGKKVVLIDVDLRKPKVHLAFGDTNTNRGVSNVLIGEHPLKKCLVTTDIENLHYIPAGSLPPNPAELIAGTPLERLTGRPEGDLRRGHHRYPSGGAGHRRGASDEEGGPAAVRLPRRLFAQGICQHPEPHPAVAGTQ